MAESILHTTSIVPPIINRPFFQPCRRWEYDSWLTCTDFFEKKCPLPMDSGVEILLCNSKVASGRLTRGLRREKLILGIHWRLNASRSQSCDNMVTTQNRKF